MKISGVQQIVTLLLKDHPHLRDDDYKLIANIWYRECKENGWDTTNILDLFAKHKLTHPESIHRCCRKVQELCPELRGKK